MPNPFDTSYKRSCSLLLLFLDMMYAIVYHSIDPINLFANARKLLFGICNECFAKNVDCLQFDH